MANSQMKNARRNAGVLVAKLAGDADSKNKLNSDDSGNSETAQCARVLAALRMGPITTLQARRKLDVLHPAARVLSLRQVGHKIETVWTDDTTSEGRVHRVAKYVLIPGDPA